jgi:hypothetical protein
VNCAQPATDLGQIPTHKTEADESGEAFSFKVSYVFNIPMHPGSLAALIAFERGGSIISRTEEYLRLLTTFHYAGTTLAIVMLWKIGKEDRKLFARKLFELLLDEKQKCLQQQHPPSSVISLAAVMQKTVRHLINHS